MNITEVVGAVIALVSAIITTILAPWIKSRVSSERLERVMAWVRVAASAAEQIYSGPGRGEEKKQYVLELLSSLGLEVDSQAVDAMIEAQVLRIKQEVL